MSIRLHDIFAVAVQACRAACLSASRERDWKIKAQMKLLPLRQQSQLTVQHCIYIALSLAHRRHSVIAQDEGVS